MRRLGPPGLAILALAMTLVWISAALLVLPSRAAVALVVRYDLESLARKSKYVVAGEVLELQAQRIELSGLGETIVTDVRIRISRVIQGSPEGEETTLRLFGGVVGDDAMFCPDSPRFEKGEKVLVFVREWRGKLWNTGWYQGKYRISDDGSKVKGGLWGREGLPISRDMPLATLEALLRGYALRPSAGAQDAAGVRGAVRAAVEQAVVSPAQASPDGGKGGAAASGKSAVPPTANTGVLDAGARNAEEAEAGASRSPQPGTPALSAEGGQLEEEGAAPVQGGKP